MLQRTILSAKELGITESQRSALLEVQRKLRTGEIPAEKLKMEYWSHAESVCDYGCIGHHCNRHGAEFKHGYDYDTPTRHLFYHYPQSPTPQMAADAIANFLSGQPAWALSKD